MCAGQAASAPPISIAETLSLFYRLQLFAGFETHRFSGRD